MLQKSTMQIVSELFSISKASKWGLTYNQVQKFLRLGICFPLSSRTMFVITIACHRVCSNGLLNIVCGGRGEIINKSSSLWVRKVSLFFTWLYMKCHYKTKCGWGMINIRKRNVIFSFHFVRKNSIYTVTDLYMAERISRGSRFLGSALCYTKLKKNVTAKRWHKLYITVL